MRACIDARPTRRWSSTRPPGPMSTAVPATRTWPCAATAGRPESWRRRAWRAGVAASCWSPPTRCSTASGPTGGATREDDAAGPRNAYGREQARRRASRAAERSAMRPGLWIVRTAWLYRTARERLPAQDRRRGRPAAPSEPLPGVATSTARPTYTRDLAAAMLDLAEATDGGRFHLVNEGSCSRLEWARAVLARLRPGRTAPPSAGASSHAPRTRPLGRPRHRPRGRRRGSAAPVGAGAGRLPGLRRISRRAESPGARRGVARRRRARRGSARGPARGRRRPGRPRRSRARRWRRTRS